MLQPVTQSLENFLTEVNNNAAQLQSTVKVGADATALPPRPCLAHQS